MLQEQFEILGYFAKEIFFSCKEKIIVLSNKLTKQDLILHLKVEPEDVSALRDEILIQASKKELTYDEQKFLRGKI